MRRDALKQPKAVARPGCTIDAAARRGYDGRMNALYGLLTRWWTAFALAVSLAFLGFAHLSEEVWGLEPCYLCLKQREVYWAAVVVAGTATIWAVVSRASRGTPRIAAFLLFVVFATGAITAGYHAGGEMKLWQLSCMVGGEAADLDSLTALALGTAPVERIVPCDAVTWRFAGLSMAGWNTLVSAVLAGFSLVAAKRPKDARAPRT
jgi:disulfide bond formation protein DsbB